MNIGNWQANIRVSVWDKGGNEHKLFGGDGDPWLTYDGADLSSNSAKTRAGNMGQEFDIGGQATRSDASLTIQWSDQVLAAFSWLESRVGKGKVEIFVTWLDREGDALDGAGATDTGIGILKGVSRPNYDGNGNAVGVMTMTVGMHEQAA